VEEGIEFARKVFDGMTKLDFVPKDSRSREREQVRVQERMMLSILIQKANAGGSDAMLSRERPRKSCAAEMPLRSYATMGKR